MAEDVRKLLEDAVKMEASDLLIISGMPVSVKVCGNIIPVGTERIMPETANELVHGIYDIAQRGMEHFVEFGDDDFPLSVAGLSRFRVSAYRQRGSSAAVIRVVRFDIPDPKSIGIPENVMSVSQMTHGLVLVTGPTGSGKSTTLACIVDAINSTRSAHIITLEDPIEYLHRNKLGAISQREIGSDTVSYVAAMRACMRQTPDVIQLGEMRDFETITAAMTAAETGQMVLSTLNTLGAANTIDRIIDVFPVKQQQQIRMLLSITLQTVISQQLLPAVGGGQVAAFEIMPLTGAVRNMIRDSKTHEIDSVIRSSAAEGMVSMDSSILSLYRAGRITAETALKFAMNPEQLERSMKQ